MTRARDNADLGDSYGVLGAGVTGGSGLTALGTVATGDISHADIVYPAGHVIQVIDATLSSIETPDENRTSETVLAVADSQINITSGNKVFVMAHAIIAVNGNTNASSGMHIREGTDTTGAIMHSGRFMGGASNIYFTDHTIMALDASPASTTPSYAMTYWKGSGGTSSVYLYSSSLDYLKIVLMEVAG